MIYCISDIHGHYCEFLTLLNSIQLGKGDTLYVLGDAVDRGPDSIKILKHIKDNEQMKLLMGNHERLMIDALINGKDYDDWVDYNGGDETMKEYGQLTEEEQHELLEYLTNLPYYCEVEANGLKFILTHAGFRLDDDMRNRGVEYIFSKQDLLDMVWIREEFYCSQGIPNRVIVYGHTPIVGGTFSRSYGREACYDIRFWDKICIDTGCAYRGGLLALRLDDMTEFYVRKGGKDVVSHVNSFSKAWLKKAGKPD